MALRLLVGDEQEYLPNSHVPLFRRKDGALFVATMPTFDGRGLVSLVPPVVPVATTTVDVYSGDSHREEEEEEGEVHDSEATPEGMGETSPLRKADILRTLPDDDDEVDVPLERGELRTAGGSSRSKVSPWRRSPVEVPTRGRSALVS